MKCLTSASLAARIATVACLVPKRLSSLWLWSAEIPAQQEIAPIGRTTLTMIIVRELIKKRAVYAARLNVLGDSGANFIL